MGVIIMFIIGIFILVLSVISYKVLKHHGYKKTGIALSLFFALVVLIPLFSMIFESELYFKSDVRKDLKIAEIVLKNDFEIESNDITGLTDYYQLTKLRISNADRDKIITQIINSNNFKTIDNIQYYSMNVIRDEESPKIIWHYRVKDEYIIETYEKKRGYSPTKLILKVNEHSTYLNLTVIQD